MTMNDNGEDVLVSFGVFDIPEDQRPPNYPQRYLAIGFWHKIDPATQEIIIHQGNIPFIASDNLEEVENHLLRHGNIRIIADNSDEPRRIQEWV